MHKMFLLFATLNSVPTGATVHIVPVETTCRQELNVVDGINRYNNAVHNGIVFYGSCESVKK